MDLEHWSVQLHVQGKYSWFEVIFQWDKIHDTIGTDRYSYKSHDLLCFPISDHVVAL